MNDHRAPATPLLMSHSSSLFECIYVWVMCFDSFVCVLLKNYKHK